MDSFVSIWREDSSDISMAGAGVEEDACEHLPTVGVDLGLSSGDKEGRHDEEVRFVG